MPLPVRPLPVLQNWDCHACTDCCRDYRVGVTDDERRRIEGQGWGDDPALAGVALFVPEGRRGRSGWRLNQRPDGACVFLDEKGGCRIHARFGSAAKPLACRLYPFVLVPAGDSWRVGYRFACPSVTANRGRPGVEHETDVKAYAALLEVQEGIAGREVPPPPLQGRQALPWSELMLFVQGLLGLLKSSGEPVERRLRLCLKFAEVCRQAGRAHRLGRKQLVELINLVGAAIESEVPQKPADVPPPTWVGRVLFRQVVALYARKDSGPHQGVSRHGRLALVKAAWRFARGTGPIPRVHGLIPDATFEQAEEPRGPLAEASERLLERYYRVKVESLQFAGPNNFGLSFWDGLESLVLTYPAMLWLARVIGGRSPDDALPRAVQIIDNNYGFNPLLGLRRQRFAFRTLARRGELARLVAWYSR